MESQLLKLETSDILSLIGEYGRWQRRVVIIVMFIAQVPLVWPIFVGIFQAPPADYWCAIPRGFHNWTVEEWRNLSSPLIQQGDKMVHDKCRIYNLSYIEIAEQKIDPINYNNVTTMACTTWEYDRSEFKNTITNKWDLVCDKEQITKFSKSLFMVGFMIGAVGSGVAADKFGRKKTVLVTTTVLLIGEIAAAFVPWYELFLSLQLVIGLCRAATAMTAYVLALELMGGRSRTLYGLLCNYTWAISIMILAGLAYFVRDWNHLQLAISLPSILFFSSYCFLPESPRWQLSTGRVKEAVKTVKAAMKKNSRRIPENLTLIPPSADQTKATVFDLFRTRNMRKNTCLLCFVWCVNALVYYGLSFSAGDLGGNIFLNVLISGGVEVFSTTLILIAVFKAGRKRPVCFFMLLTGTACLCTIVIPSGDYAYNWPTITLANIGKFGVSASFNIIWIYSLEVYPTIVRNVGVGTNSMFARVGAIIAPFLFSLSDVSPHLPFAIPGALSIVGGLLILLVPETRYLNLPDNLEEGENLGVTVNANYQLPSCDSQFDAPEVKVAGYKQAAVHSESQTSI